MESQAKCGRLTYLDSEVSTFSRVVDEHPVVEGGTGRGVRVSVGATNLHLRALLVTPATYMYFNDSFMPAAMLHYCGLLENLGFFDF